MNKRIVSLFLGGYVFVLVFLSHPLPFLEGDYFGFWPTLGLLSLLTVPLLVSVLAVWRGVVALVRRGPYRRLLCGVLGAAVLVIYPLSFFGVLKGGVLVFGFPFATLLILGLWLWEAVQICISRRKK